MSGARERRDLTSRSMVRNRASSIRDEPDFARRVGLFDMQYRSMRHTRGRGQRSTFLTYKGPESSLRRCSSLQSLEVHIDSRVFPCPLRKGLELLPREGREPHGWRKSLPLRHEPEEDLRRRRLEDLERPPRKTLSPIGVKVLTREKQRRPIAGQDEEGRALVFSLLHLDRVDSDYSMYGSHATCQVRTYGCTERAAPRPTAPEKVDANRDRRRRHHPDSVRVNDWKNEGHIDSTQQPRHGPHRGQEERRAKRRRAPGRIAFQLGQPALRNGSICRLHPELRPPTSNDIESPPCAPTHSLR
jgi:hypothetical protein